MARRYAGILGLAAFAAVALRGAVHGDSAQHSLLLAAAALVVFAAIGGIVGRIARQTVEQAVRQKFALNMKAALASDSKPREK